MRYKSRVLIWIACTLFPLVLLSQPPGISKTYAIVIGISAYQNKALPVLKYADTDASMFAAYLQSTVGGNVPAEQIKLLLNEEATIAAVYDAIDWLKENCHKDDLAYIYFSGHGDVETDKASGTGYLLAYNTPPNNYPNNAISITDLNRYANLLTLNNGAKVVLITDACHSGKLAGDFFKGKQLAAGQLRQVLNNEVRLASCAADEEAAEGPDWGGGRGVFSYYLLLGLNGFAHAEIDGSIRLRELSSYLDSCFAADKILRADNHKQRPILDGNPLFPMAVVTKTSVAAAKAALAEPGKATTNLSAGLQAFKPPATQPIDYFFTKVSNGGLDSLNDVFPNGRLDYWNKKKVRAIENVIDFSKYSNIGKDSFALAVVNDCINYENEHAASSDSLGNGLFGAMDNSFDSLIMLKKQLEKNPSLNSRFVEKFIQLVHEKGQDMINAYLTGDLAELEKRQYYFAGNRSYGDFISMLNVVVKLVPVNHSMYHLLKVHQSYISGLFARLQMATVKNNSSLLKAAVASQWQALQLEPYAAYIHNEIGNLYIQQKKYDSAAYYFNLATVLSPTWAIPWSNRIRLNLALNNIPNAKKAIHTADSLQPKLAYVMMNAGLVMEKEKNWLAAESYYLKAIEENKIHFLPYERLAKIYLLTGEFAKADTFLFATKTRKADFALNDEDYRFGVSLGGPDPWHWFDEEQVCAPDSFSSGSYWLPYKQFLQALALPDSLPGRAALSVQLIRQALAQRPGMPLAQHYLGKNLYSLGKWQEAATAIESAITGNTVEEAFKSELNNFNLSRNAAADTAGMLKLLEELQCRRYFYLQDFYLLGSIYEKLGRIDNAARQYKKIAAEENKRQASHAVYDGFYDRKKNGTTATDEPEPDKTFYDTPIKMAGNIKLARLWESAGDYEKAEQALLQQVALNQAAGFARRDVNITKQGERNEAKPDTYNYYWLSVNQVVESETYNFYKRVTERFPRDGDWKEKAGLFLYKRLAMSFAKMPVELYAGFYKTVAHFAYPFQPGEYPAEDMQPVKIELPGTQEQLVIDMPVYDAVKEALEMLQQSVKLSGEVLPKPQVQQAIAAVNSWMGNQQAALNNYHEAIAAAPKNAVLRNKLLNCLVAYKELPLALNQLEILYQQHQLARRQLLQLATYQVLSSHFNTGIKTLQAFLPVTKGERDTLMLLYAKLNWLQNKPQKAISYLTNSIKTVITDQPKSFDTDATEQQFTSFCQYQIARLYAFMKKDREAMAALKTALDNGFDYSYVLSYDEAWASLRKTNQWSKLLSEYNFERQYTISALTKEIDPVWYRIPD